MFGDSQFEVEKKADECVIAESSKQDILIALQQVSGITEAMLFPDFDGLARLRAEDIPYTQPSTARYKELAKSAYQREDYEEAILNYDAVIHLDPDDMQTYFDRGRARLDMRQPEQALADFNEVVRLTPNNADAYFNRGSANDLLNQHRQALTDYDMAIQLNNDHPIAYASRGQLKAKQGRWSEAQQDLQKALELARPMGSAGFIAHIENLLREINSHIP